MMQIFNFNFRAMHLAAHSSVHMSSHAFLAYPFGTTLHLGISGLKVIIGTGIGAGAGIPKGVAQFSSTAFLSQLTSNQEQVITNNFASKDTCFALSPAQLEKLKLTSETIFKLTNETLLETIKQKELEPWTETRYGAVKSLWNKDQTGVNLMRIDYVWDQAGNFKILELNTASHSGWIKSGLAEQEPSAKRFGTPLAPESMFYAKYLLEKLGPRIVIIVIRKDYKEWYKELNWLPKQMETLGGKCQITYLSEANPATPGGIQDIINFNPTGLFWKSNSRLVEHADLVLEVAKLGLPQIPSFASLFIAGDKAFLATLRKKDTTGAIPQTYVLSKSDLAKNLSLLPRDKAVLKPGDLSRGEGIKFGKYFDEEAWQTEIKVATNSREEWVMQELCYLRNTNDGKYEDIIVFVADGLVRGISSRISESEVINVSKGGLLQSVVLDDKETN